MKNINMASNKRRQTFPKQAKTGVMPYALMVGGFIVLIILAVIFIPIIRESGDNKISSLDERINQLEVRLNRIENLDKRLSLLDKLRTELEISIMERLDSLEASISRRMDQKVKELDTLHMEAKQKTPDKKKIVKVSKKKTESRYHEVSAGETLYRISRKYGLTVEELRRLNKISPESVIYVGQKLIINREKSR